MKNIFPFTAVLRLLPALVFFAFANYSTAQSLVINEFMAANSTIPDESGEFDDWIELFNSGSVAVDLNGYFISDDINDPMAVQIDTSVVIEPGEFVLIWADKDLTQGKLHVNFKLSAGGEQISLMTPGGSFVDSLSYSLQLDNISYGRGPDGSDDFYFFDNPTPGSSNPSSGDFEKLEIPVFSVQGGIYPGTVSLELSDGMQDASIYYTLDGEEPDESSVLYSGQFNLDSTTVVRAKAFKDGYLASDIASHAYFVDETYSLPILSLVTSPDDMFGPDGIYTNPTEGGSEWERYCQAQYFKNENLEFSIDCGIRIQGSSGVLNDKKSFRLFFDDDYGQARLEYPLFEGRAVEDFKNIVLRAGYDDGLDSGEEGTLLKDPMGNRMYEVTGGLGTGGNWAILTINGEYWGIYELRESMNEHFIESHTGWNDFDMIRFDKFDPELRAGTWEDWDYLRDFLENNDFTDEANYAIADSLIDIDNLVNLLAFVQCSGYAAWGYGVSTYKEKTPGGKWEYTVWDMDKTHKVEYWNPHDDYDLNTPTTWANFINAALTPNESFRNQLVNRAADLLNTMYKTENATVFVDSLKEEIIAEIPGEIDRWNPAWTIDDYNLAVDVIYDFIEDRPDLLRGYTVEYYGFSGTNTINLDITGQGTVKISTLEIESFPWSGIYYEEVPVSITAVAAPGYTFTGWSDSSLPNEPSITIDWLDTYDLTAYFTQGSVETADIVINEINYNSQNSFDSGDWIELYNASGSAVDLSAWYFKDSSNDYFNLPPNTTLAPNAYLVLVEDSVRFQTQYPNVDNFIGDFGNSITGDFKLNNNGEYISINNANSTFIDTVEYDDNLPWQVAADGNGPSLQLISPTLDNALASSWDAKAPTPGAPNDNVQLSQTIDFPSISDKLTTDTPFMLYATASSGLPVSYSLLSGPASINGNVVTLDGVVGTIVIQASQAGNADYTAAPSVEQSFEVNQQSQVIDFPSIADKLTTDAPFALSATASSGLTVSYSVLSGPASVSGNTVTLDGVAGTVVIQANQSGNADYSAAPSVEQSFEVNQQSQVIDFPSIADKLTTDAPFALSATASSGLTVSYSVLSGPASVSGNTVTLDGVAGTVVIQANQSGNADYSAAPSVEQSFEVNQQSQTIDFPAIADKLTTNAPFTLSATASSGLTVSYSVLSGPASVSSNTVTLDGVAGIVVIEANQSGNDDYTAAPSVEQSFEVNQQSQTIDFPSIADKLTTDVPFTLPATASSGLTVSYSVLSGPASVNGNTVTLDGVAGTVVVEASQSGNDDYTVAPSVEQSFEVNQQSQTIDFPSIADKLTTDAPFTLSATASSGLTVTYSVLSGPASISGNTVTLDGVTGTVVIQASQSGNDDYIAASNVEQSFEVNQQSQTIDFPAIPNKLTSDFPFQVTATASSNLTVSFSIVSGPASIIGNTITLDGVEGTVVVQADQIGDNDYLAAPSVQQSFVVSEEILLSQTIDFFALSDKFTTDLPFDVMASASSGLPVTFSIVSGPASIVGNTITLDGVTGTIVVQADQIGDDDYYPAPGVQQSFEVLLTPQTIDFSALSDKLTTDIPFDIAASASSGLSVNFEIISGPASISGNTITLDGVTGTVVVQASQTGDDIYAEATMVEQSFEVTLTAQIIGFDIIADKLTTDIPFDVMATASSGLPVSFDIVSGPATVSGNTITLDGVAGTVVVQATQAGDDTYAAAIAVDQSFEVTLTPQTIDFEMIDDKLTTDLPFEIMATSTSGLPVSFEISGPASIVGNMITLDGVPGLVIVQANQEGDNTYAPAPSVEQSFEVLMLDSNNELDDFLAVISVYPNPVSQQLNVELSAQIIGTYQLMIHDVYGREFYKASYEGGADIVKQIDVHDFADGLYMLSFLQNGGLYVIRFVKGK